MTPRPAGPHRGKQPQRKDTSLKQNLGLSVGSCSYYYKKMYHFDNKRTKNKNYFPRISVGRDAGAARPTEAATPGVTPTSLGNSRGPVGEVIVSWINFDDQSVPIGVSRN